MNDRIAVAADRWATAYLERFGPNRKRSVAELLTAGDALEHASEQLLHHVLLAREHPER